MKRFTDTDLWDKQWFMELPAKIKCLVKFVRDKCDSSGVWQPNWVLATTYIGEKVTENDLLGVDAGKQFEKLPNGTILCLGFIFFQYGTLSENCAPHKKIIALLKKHGIFERVSKGYFKPNETPKEEDMEAEEDKETEEVKEEEKEEACKNQKPEVVMPFLSQIFFEAWDNWKVYKKKEFNFKYKSEHSEQSALRELCKLGEGQEIICIQIIEQSMASGWKGFFQLKKQDNGTSKNGQQSGISPQEALQRNFDRADKEFGGKRNE